MAMENTQERKGRRSSALSRQKTRDGFKENKTRRLRFGDANQHGDVFAGAGSCSTTKFKQNGQKIALVGELSVVEKMVSSDSTTFPQVTETDAHARWLQGGINSPTSAIFWPFCLNFVVEQPQSSQSKASDVRRFRGPAPFWLTPSETAKKCDRRGVSPLVAKNQECHPERKQRIPAKQSAWEDNPGRTLREDSLPSPQDGIPGIFGSTPCYGASLRCLSRLRLRRKMIQFAPSAARLMK